MLSTTRLMQVIGYLLLEARCGHGNAAAVLHGHTGWSISHNSRPGTQLPEAAASTAERGHTHEHCAATLVNTT